MKGRKLPGEQERLYCWCPAATFLKLKPSRNPTSCFVGYGVVAPEYGWDDYKGCGCQKCLTILMLVNRIPQSPIPKIHLQTGSPAMFKGDAMTYYGRWTYKYEIASEKGAAAAIIIHEIGPAGYPFEVVADSWGGENFGIVRPDHVRWPGGRRKLDDLRPKAAELCRMAGLALAALKKAAIRKDFKPVFLWRAQLPVSKSKKRIAYSRIAQCGGQDRGQRSCAQKINT